MAELISPIYVHREGQQTGPHSREELIAGIEQGTFSATDKAWTSGLADWMDLSVVLSTSRLPCPQCKGVLSQVSEAPQRSTGIIVIVLGIILAPFCVGIVLIVWGLILVNERKYYWHCRGCGRTYPA
jgi:GYF domain 2